MISIKRYLDQRSDAPVPAAGIVERGAGETHGGSGCDAKGEEEVGGPALDAMVLDAMVRAYRSALRTMGRASLEACPAVGSALIEGLSLVDDSLAEEVTSDTIQEAVKAVRGHLVEWGRNTSRHYDEKTDEVRQILTVLSRTAESALQRDEGCAGRFAEVTRSLTKIATLDDLTEIRISIEASAAELERSIERMTAESRAATESLRAELNVHQARLAAANHMALTDSLTGLRNRLWMEHYIAQHIDEGSVFCVLLVDIDRFKSVNDTHGHLAGDELLQQFSAELRMAFRSGDAVARWGGDEFLLLVDCDAHEARTQIERLRRWAYGEYTVQGRLQRIKLTVEASVGLAEYRPFETMKSLLERADADMYREKEIAQAACLQALCSYAA